MLQRAPFDVDEPTFLKIFAVIRPLNDDPDKPTALSNRFLLAQAVTERLLLKPHLYGEGIKSASPGQPRPKHPAVLC